MSTRWKRGDTTPIELDARTWKTVSRVISTFQVHAGDTPETIKAELDLDEEYYAAEEATAETFSQWGALCSFEADIPWPRRPLRALQESGHPDVWEDVDKWKVNWGPEFQRAMDDIFGLIKSELELDPQEKRAIEKFRKEFDYDS